MGNMNRKGLINSNTEFKIFIGDLNSWKINAHLFTLAF